MVFIKQSDYLRENRKTRPNIAKPKKVKNPINHTLEDRLTWCPRLCKQSPSGRKGKKTYDPITKHCHGCGGTW